jgi:hypothetical protein
MPRERTRPPARHVLPRSACVVDEPVRHGAHVAEGSRPLCWGCVATFDARFAEVTETNAFGIDSSVARCALAKRTISRS